MSGNVWKFGDNIDTDAIIPGRYLVINDPVLLAEHAFEGVRPEFAKHVKTGDIIVAGNNFGCGSSREHAPLALKGAGISYIIGKSFARIFFRNAINIGLAVLECADADKIRDADEIEVDINTGTIINKTLNEAYHAMPLPDFLQTIVRCGGLIEYARQLVSRNCTTSLYRNNISDAGD